MRSRLRGLGLDMCNSVLESTANAGGFQLRHKTLLVAAIHKNILPYSRIQYRRLGVAKLLKIRTHESGKNARFFFVVLCNGDRLAKLRF